MIIEYTETTSTQQILKDLFEKGEAEFYDAVSAVIQTEGRGRSGKSFYSPEGGLYISMLLPYEEADTITRKAAACAVRAIEKTTGKKDLRVKPVNDIYLAGRKVAGILAEAVTDLSQQPKAVVLGIGINLIEPEEGFPADIAGRAGALYSRASEIGWVGGLGSLPTPAENPAMSIDAQIFESLRQKLKSRLVFEFKKLTDPLLTTELLAEYEELLIKEAE